MADETDHPAPAGSLDRAFRGTVGREATAFGFSIVISTTFGALQFEHNSPDRLKLVLFAVGAGSSFVILTALLSRGFRRPLPQHKTDVVALAAGMNLVSVLSGVGVAMATAALIDTTVVWALCPLFAGMVYLIVESLEELLAERLQSSHGDGEAEAVDE